jgi:hypothetical protein
MLLTFTLRQAQADICGPAVQSSVCTHCLGALRKQLQRVDGLEPLTTAFGFAYIPVQILILVQVRTFLAVSSSTQRVLTPCSTAYSSLASCMLCKPAIVSFITYSQQPAIGPFTLPDLSGLSVLPPYFL